MKKILLCFFVIFAVAVFILLSFKEPYRLAAGICALVALVCLGLNLMSPLSQEERAEIRKQELMRTLELTPLEKLREWYPGTNDVELLKLQRKDLYLRAVAESGSNEIIFQSGRLT